MKKLVSILTSILIVGTLLNGWTLPASADTFINESFNSYNGELAYGGMTMNNTSAGHRFAAVKGKALKAKNDTAIRMYSPEGIYTTNDVNINKGLSTTLADGQLLHIGFDVLNEDQTCNKVLRVDFTDKKYSALQIETNGGLNFFGTRGGRVNIGEWHRIDLYLYKSTGTATLYVDGALTVTSERGADAFTPTLSLMRLYYVLSAKSTSGSDITYHAAGINFDNMICEVQNTANIVLPTSKYSGLYVGFDGIVSNQSFKTVGANSTSQWYESGNTQVSYGNFKEYTGAASGGIIQYDVVSNAGLFGKDPSDKVLKMHNDTGYYTIAANQYFDDGYVSVGPTGMGDFADGSKFKYAFSIALDEDSLKTTKSIPVLFNGAKTFSNIFEAAAGTGAVKVLGQSLGISLTTNKWYHFEILFTVGNGVDVKNSAIVLVDGKQITADPILFTGVSGQEYGKVKSFVTRGGYKASRSGKTDASGNIEFLKDSAYYDDIQVQYAADGNLPANEVTLSHSNPAIQSKITVGKIERSENITVEDFLSGASAGADTAITVRNKAGQSVTSGALVGNYVVVTPLYGPDFYYSAEASTILASTFDGSGSNTISQPWALAKIGGNYSWNSSEYRGGVAGKAANDTAYLLKSNGYTGQTVGTDPGGDPFIGVTYANPIDLAENFTMECDVLAPSKGGEAYVSLGINSAAANSLFQFAADGKIRFWGSNAGEYQSGRWYKVAAVFYKGSNKVDLYVNGKQVAKDLSLSWINNDIQSLYRVKLSVNVPVNSSNFEAGFDNFKLYFGQYHPDGESVDLVSDTYYIDGQNNQIFVDLGQEDYIEASGLLNGIEKVTGESYTVYYDSSFEESDYVVEGSILMITSASKNVLEYYTIRNLFENGIGELTCTSAGAAADTTFIPGSFSAALEVCGIGNAKPVTLVLAQYRGKELMGIKIVSESITGYQKLSASLEALNEPNSQIKVMVLDGFSSMTPLKQVKTLNIAAN